jgi:ABC-type phosphate transport system substrate-binding protein
MTKRVLTLLLLLLPALASNLAAADGFVVVVNAANPVTSLAAGEISRMFLHKTLRWPGGGRVVPIDLPESSPVRDAFSRAIHGRRTSAIQAYWQALIFSGRDVPPPERDSGELLGLVRSDVGAIGYVAPGTNVGEGVRVLKVTQ